MKISGPSASASVGGVSAARRGVDGFAPSGAGAASSAGGAERAAPTSALGSLDALLALQETGGPLERRRRALRRANRMLDGLDGLRLALIDDAPASTVLSLLRRARGEPRDRTDDAGLEALLDQVDVRAAVELAKVEPRRAA